VTADTLQLEMVNQGSLCADLLLCRERRALDADNRADGLHINRRHEWRSLDMHYHQEAGLGIPTPGLTWAKPNAKLAPAVTEPVHVSKWAG
jgi:hypothetical protein